MHHILKLLLTLGRARPRESKKALTRYLKPHKNIDYKQYTIWQAHQQERENMDEYHTHLRCLVTSYEFTNADYEIRGQIIRGCLSAKLKKQILQDPQMTLVRILNTPQVNEIL